MSKIHPSFRKLIKPEVFKISEWLRLNGKATKEEIESNTGISLTNEILAQGDFWGLIRFVPELGGYV